jgi:hypothetical protein
MASTVEICNIALSNLGDQLITSLTEANARARACNLRFNDTRDAVLRSHPWNCAMSRATLAVSGTPDWGYSNSFALPTDCLRVLDVEDPDTEWKIEGRNIVSDGSTIKIRYIAQVTDTTLFDSTLVQAIALKLAWEIAETLTGNIDLKREMWQKYQFAISEARSNDAMEGTPEKIEADEWLLARRGYSTRRNISTPSTGYAYS